MKSIAEVVLCNDVESALTALRNREYDCILYDPFSGGGKSLEDIQKMRTNRNDLLSQLVDYFISSVRRENTLNQHTTIIAVSYAPLGKISGLPQLFSEKGIEEVCLSIPGGYDYLKQKIVNAIKYDD